MSVQAKASAVRLLLFDVDGVLTDGAVLMHADGSESKSFHIRDGAALVWAQRAGLSVGFCRPERQAPPRSARPSSGSASSRRGSHKADAYEAICQQAGLEDSAVAFMGDDLLDLPVLSRVGLSAAPADAAPEVLASVDWASSSSGGRGAARELIELAGAQGRWNDVRAAIRRKSVART